MRQSSRQRQLAAADHFDDSPPAFWDRYGRETVERLRLKPGSVVRDVGCGSGASAGPLKVATASAWRMFADGRRIGRPQLNATTVK